MGVRLSPSITIVLGVCAGAVLLAASAAAAGPVVTYTSIPPSTASPSPAASRTATPLTAGGGESDGSNPDILELALLTVGAAGGAALLGLSGYVIRKRIGFSPHEPPPGGGPASGPEHH